MALSRTHREWSILIGEYNICKKKLQSKREALKILTKEWQTIQRERDIYKNKINQLQQDLDRYILKDKKLQNEKQQSYEAQKNKNNHVTQSSDLVSCTSKDSISLHLLLEYKVENKALKKDLLELKRLYVESQEDVQILRERMRKQSSSSSIVEESSSSFVVLEGQEDFILQLEEYKEQVASLEQELKSIRDENSDVLIERDHYKDKYERLNTQLNYILGADDRRLVDIDALVLDNKYLKEKLSQVEEERSVEKESIQKYEAAFKKRKDKLLGRGSFGKRLPSYYTKYSPEHSAKTVSELRDVANILSETITEKNLALSHQRSANSILGKRVSELENKLKTLEVSGLWSLPGHRGYGSLNLENSTKTNGEEKRNETRVEQQDLPVERLEWDNSASVVELKKGKMEINGNDLRDISEIIDDSEKISRDFTTLDLSPNSVFSDGELSESGCQSICLQGKPCERKGIFSFSSHKNNGILNGDEPCLLNGRNSVMEKHSRSNSAPCSFAGNSFDVDDEDSNCDFDAQQLKTQNSEGQG